MPIRVRLIRENGDELRSATDHGGLVTRIAVPDRTSRLVRYIDLYGDTYFNALQMKDFLDDWMEAKPLAASSEDESFWHEVNELAQECERKPHRYLKFVGD